MFFLSLRFSGQSLFIFGTRPLPIQTVNLTRRVFKKGSLGMVARIPEAWSSAHSQIKDLTCAQSVTIEQYFVDHINMLLLMFWVFILFPPYETLLQHVSISQ